MLKRTAAHGRSIAYDLKIAAGRRMLRSRSTLRLARAVLRRRTALKPYKQVELDFLLGLGERLYADRSTPVIWSNVFVPCELIWGLGLVPFYPETAAAVGAILGLSSVGVEQAGVLSYPADLCTFHRSAAGLRAAGLYPRADIHVASSNLCDVAGQVLANFAQADGRPFFFLDVPQSEDEAAVEYMTAQLLELVDGLAVTLGVTFEPERMRQAICLSNQARSLALEVVALREAHPAPLRGSARLDQLGMLTAMFGHPAGVAYYRALREYTLERIQRGEPEQANQKARIYWMHLGPFFPAELFPHLEDDLGVVIAFEEASTLWWEELDEGQPFRSMARKMLAMVLNGPVERRLDITLRNVARFGCEGVIHFSHWGCRQSTGALQVIRHRLRREGVPFLDLDGDCIDPTNLQWGPLRTRVEAFVETLR
jgi:benzoyl-CoA reductase/2-hydroxyglutaryl-CoA dehydratase subunit BcrC/BadD/HgdB